LAGAELTYKFGQDKRLKQPQIAKSNTITDRLVSHLSTHTEEY